MLRRSAVVGVVLLCACDPLPQASPIEATANPEPGYSFAAEEKAYLDELDRLRGLAGLDPVDRVVDTVDESIVQQTTEAIRSGATAPREGLHTLVGHFSKKTGFPFSAATYVPAALDGWTPSYPQELRQTPRAAAVVSMTYAASGFLVLVVYGDMDYTP